MDVSCVPTADVLGYEDRRINREELRSARRSNDDENDRVFRILMRKYPDTASQNDLTSRKMEYVGLSESARSMAEASKNYGKGIAKDLGEKAETLAEIDSMMGKRHRHMKNARSRYLKLRETQWR